MLDARPSVLWLALVVLACDSSALPRDVVALGGGSDPSTVANPAESTVDSGTPTDQDAGLCAALVESARVLLESHQRCQVDQDCRDEAIVAPCPGPVSCSAFVRKDTDTLYAESSRLEADYRKSCGKCAAAKCGAREPTQAYCDASKHCAGRPLPGAPSTGPDAAAVKPAGDAGRADASADPGRADAGADASSSPAQSDAGGAGEYACKVDLDCVITNVGNCCGYYPRCANVSATFAPPVCTGGQVGVCGFPSIDSCECRQNTCVSIQAGNPI